VEGPPTPIANTEHTRLAGRIVTAEPHTDAAFGAAGPSNTVDVLGVVLGLGTEAEVSFLNAQCVMTIMGYTQGLCVPVCSATFVQHHHMMAISVERHTLLCPAPCPMCAPSC